MTRLQQTYRAIILGGMLGLLLLGAPAAATSGRPSGLADVEISSTESLARVEGRVIDARTGQPVAGARISVPAFRLEVESARDGRFQLPGFPLGRAAAPGYVRVTAAGFGLWEIEEVWFIAGDTLILTVELAQAPQKIVVPPPKALRTEWPALDDITDQHPTALTDQMDLPLPDTITVRVSGSPFSCSLWRPYELETVDFKDYVRHVLPNEWLVVEGGEMIGYWESMRAGAVAVKMYAWYWIAQDGKWEDADVWDSTCDQVYNPAVEYASSNAVIDYTWNWRLTRDGLLVETNYRAYHSQCPNPDSCMGQIDADLMAASGAIWNNILAAFYQDTDLTPIYPPPIGGSMLRYFGNGYGVYDRVRVRIDNPNDNDPGPPADVGAGDFTIELWIRAHPSENNAPAVSCGPNQNWIHGNVFLDRERRGGDRHYGLSIAGGKPVFGVTGEDFGGGPGQLTLCGSRDIRDGEWHHLAVQRRRSDGYLWMYVDGQLEASGDGPDGDISYPDNALPLNAADPYLVIGAGKRDDQPAVYPPFSGWLDELHLSGFLRYYGDFTPPNAPFSPDPATVALYHFDDHLGNFIQDSSGAPGGPSNGERKYGGGINGPDWFFSDLFMTKTFLPYLHRP